MSYCRFSSDDFQCDVYVYADCSGGWTTHVASNRIIYDEPLPEKVDFNDMDAYFDRHKKVMDIVNISKREKIGLEYDGRNFNHDTPKECADNLIMLRGAGYNVPQYAVDALLEE